MHSDGNRKIEILEWDKPEINDDQIEVKTVMTGICRSDIAAYNGWEDPMPLGMFGHEGLGIVSKVGRNLNSKIKEGDFVATWSDPAYGEYYNADYNQFAKIPGLYHEYLMQPVACAINIFMQTQKYIDFLKYNNERILLIGSGFMSLIIGQLTNNIDIVGKSNLHFWEKFNKNIYSDFKQLPQNKYKVIIDLSSKAENFYKITDELSEVESVLCYAATPFTPVKTNFFKNCWNCHTIIMPSPRNTDFNKSMEYGVEKIQSGELNTKILWTKSYEAFNLTDMVQAFKDGTNRDENYLRGYFKF